MGVNIEDVDNISEVESCDEPKTFGTEDEDFVPCKMENSATNDVRLENYAGDETNLKNRDTHNILDIFESANNENLQSANNVNLQNANGEDVSLKNKMGSVGEPFTIENNAINEKQLIEEYLRNLVQRNQNQPAFLRGGNRKIVYQKKQVPPNNLKSAGEFVLKNYFK